MNLRRKTKKTQTRDVVTALQEQVRQAQALASIPRQDLLSDPRLNPATRGKADALAAERLSTRLELEHRRVLRSERETDRRAEEAIRAAQAVDAARAATDPAYTVLALVRNRGRFAALSLGASIVLSVGSAIGLEAAVSAYHLTAPTGIGYLGEVALTGMSTSAIIWAGLLARSGAFPTGGRRAALIALIAAPLMVSIFGSALGSGPVGAVCSLGAAAFSAFAYLTAVTSADAIATTMGRITTTATPVDDPPHGELTQHHTAGQALEVVGEELAEEAADYLRERNRSHGRPSERVRSSEDDQTRSHGSTAPDDNGDDTDSAQVNHPERPSERFRSHGENEASERVLTAQERQRLEKRQRVRRIAEYLRAHPGAQTGEIAEALRLGESTVRRLRREIEDGGV